MALCYALPFAVTAGAILPLSAGEHSPAMVMHEQSASMNSHAEHGAANTAHDCCDDSALASCCSEASALKTKSTLDLDLQFVAVFLSWLVFLNEPTLSVSPTVDTVSGHSLVPRLHLLLCVFLD